MQTMTFLTFKTFNMYKNQNKLKERKQHSKGKLKHNDSILLNFTFQLQFKTFLGQLCPLCPYRQTGIGASCMFARMGGVLAPLINMLHNHSPATPLLIFGASPLLGAVLTLALPGTADRPLPDTVEDAENWDMRYNNFTSVFTGWDLVGYCFIQVKGQSTQFLYVSLLLSLNDPEQNLSGLYVCHAQPLQSDYCVLFILSPAARLPALRRRTLRCLRISASQPAAQMSRSYGIQQTRLKCV